MLAKDIIEKTIIMYDGVEHEVMYIFRRKNSEGNVVVDIFLEEIGNRNYTKIACRPNDIIIMKE